MKKLTLRNMLDGGAILFAVFLASVPKDLRSWWAFAPARVSDYVECLVQRRCRIFERRRQATGCHDFKAKRQCAFHDTVLDSLSGQEDGTVLCGSASHIVLFIFIGSSRRSSRTIVIHICYRDARCTNILHEGKDSNVGRNECDSLIPSWYNAR